MSAVDMAASKWSINRDYKGLFIFYKKGRMAMTRYVIRRILNLIPTLLAVIFIVFFITSLTPGDPGTLILGDTASKEAIYEFNESVGYNDPFIIRYLNYIIGILHGSLGSSWRTGRPVLTEVLGRLPVSATLAAGAMVFGAVIGISLGIISAVKQYSILDYTTTTIAMILASFPGFWIGMIMIVVFSLYLGWFPAFGIGSVRHYILPWITTGCAYVASLLRLTRTSMLESIRMDYIRTARAKGQKESIVVLRHALRNALLPVVTSLGMSFGVLLGGTVTIESVFSLPGVGTMIIEAIRLKDIPLVVGGTVSLCTGFTIVMVIVDISYAFIDPRIKSRYMKR